MIKDEHQTEEPENSNPDRCDVCKVRLTVNLKTCKTERESQSAPQTTRRNPSRSAKRNVVYRENDAGEDHSLYNINQHCWKCSENQSLNVKTETLTMEDQSEPSSAAHLQSDILGKLSDKRFKCDICDKTFTKNSSLKVHVRAVHDKIRAFPCPHCPYKATQRSSLENHILTHTGEKNFKCDICDKKFSRNGELKKHITTVHDKVRAFPCPHCPYQSKQRGYLESHVLKHTGEKNFKCNICEKMFTEISSVRQHIRTVHDKIKPFECPHCPYKAGDRNSIKKHIFTHTGEKNYKCNICEKRFTTSSTKLLHVRTVHYKVKAFPCPHCPYKAAQGSGLQKHIVKHTGERNFKCDICHKTFTQRGSLRLHIRLVHDKVKAFPCPHCPFMAPLSESLNRHIATHTGERNFKCDICEKTFAVNSALKKHIRAVHDKVRNYPCPHCPYEAPTNGSLQNHIRTHTGEKNFKCDICDKKFNEKGRVKHHIRVVHDKIKPFECPHCPFKAAERSNLANHIAYHIGEKNFKCDICKQTFTQYGNLRKHIQGIHENIRPFPCPHCPHKSKRNDHLKSHLLTHTGEKNFKCDICDKQFSHKNSLRLHIRLVHDKIRSFECPHCPYKASLSGCLQKHILTHTGEKNFKCDICDKKFTLKSSLRLHIRTVHDKIKPFKCPHCPYKAGESGTLKNHILTHTGEKNFMCNICDRTFSQRGNLIQHIKTVHDKIRPFPCPHCPYKAGERGNLKAHILTHTREKD